MKRAGRADGIAAFRQESPARERWPDPVKSPRQTGLRGEHDPLREIAHVDELDRIVRGSGHQHLAAAIKPRRPIGEPSVGSSGPTISPARQIKAFSPTACSHATLAAPEVSSVLRSTSGAVGPAAARYRPAARSAVVGIYAHRRHQGPMRDAGFKCRDRATHLARMPRHIDDRIERRAESGARPSGSSRSTRDEVPAPGATTPVNAARRAGHVMALRAGVRRDGAPEKLRAAEDQQAHSYPRPCAPASAMRPGRAQALSSFLSSITCTPLEPLTTWVMRTSAARLHSV